MELGDDEPIRPFRDISKEAETFYISLDAYDLLVLEITLLKEEIILLRKEIDFLSKLLKNRRIINRIVSSNILNSNSIVREPPGES